MDDGSLMSASVATWLQQLGLGKYASLFEDNDIDWELLPSLDQDVLKDIGIRSAGHRLRILRAAAALQSRDQTPGTVDAAAAGALRLDDDISAWSRIPGERKPVTMLFADIVGSTAATEHLDAEEAHALLYRATRQMCEAVEGNLGTVCRFMGDGIMAMFGAPVASERHALEACRAALDMQRRIADYARELEASHGAGTQIRVGLNSGEIVVLEVGDDPDKPEYDASGPTVALAARMEQSAAPGTIQMTASTHALAGNLIEADALEPVRVKGVSEPVQAFRLRKVRSSLEPSAFSVYSQFVGRRAELAQFAGLLGECLKSREGQTIYMRGEPGIGKTRLIEAMIRQAAERGFIPHKVLVLDFGVGKGQEAIPALVRSLLGIKQGSGKRKREKAVEQLEASGILDPEQRVYLNDLLDLTQPLELRTLYDAMEVAARSDGKHRTVGAIIARLARHNPLLVVVEGLHWADPETLAYLASLTAVVAESPALMIMSSRLEGDPIDTNWRARTSEHPVVTWDLGPLRKEDSLRLAQSCSDADEAFVRRCIERAEGNPLFLEQLLLGGDQSTTDSLPDSIKSLVLSRLDHLPGADKLALRAASILGQRFAAEGLRHLVDNPDYDCQELVNHQLVRPDGEFYIFAHALIQGGIYASLLKGQRAGLHRRAAEWFAERDSILHAEHLDRAGDHGAASAYLRAAQRQLDLYRPERALQLVRRGLEIAPDSEVFALACLEGETLRILGRIPESIGAYRFAGEASDGEIGRCQARIGMAAGLGNSDAHEEMLALLDEAEEIAREHRLSHELAQIHQMRGGVLFFRGEIDACLAANEASLRHAREAGSADVEAMALSGLADAEYNRGRFISARQYFDACIELAREHGFGRVIAANLSLRGYVTCWQNDLDATARDYAEALEQARKTGDQRAEMLASMIGGSFWASIGKLDDGERWIDDGLEIARRIGSQMFEGVCLYLLARVALARDARNDARRLAHDGVELLRNSEAGMSFGGPIALGILALASEESGERRAALGEAEALLAAGSTGHNYLNFYEDAIEVCLQLQDWDEAERYARALEEYTLAEPLPRCRFAIARGRALAARGRGNRATETLAELRELHAEAERIGLVYALPALAQAIDDERPV